MRSGPNEPVFRPHGSTRSVPQGRILLTTAEGPFNMEALKQYVADTAGAFAKMEAGGPWGHIIEYKGSAMVVPEFLARLREQLQIRTPRMKRVAMAHVIAPGVEGHGFMEQHFRRALDGILPFGTFESVEDARSWVNEQLARSA